MSTLLPHWPADFADFRVLLDTLIGQLSESTVFLMDSDGVILSWNSGVRDVLGYDAVEFVGLDVRTLFVPEDLVRGAAEREMATAAQCGKAPDQRWHVRKDGTRFYCDGVVSALRNPAGRLRGFLKIMRDATADLHRAHRSAHFAALVASSSDAIVSVTREAVITSWNGAAERMFGFSASEIIGHSIRRIVPPDRTEEPDRYLSRAADGETLAGVKTVRATRDGRLLDVSVTVSPIRGDSPTIDGYSVILRDISESRETQSRLDLAVSAHHIGIFDWNMRTDHVVWNAQQYEILGVQPDQFDGQFESWARLAEAEDVDRLRRELDQAWKQHTTQLSFSFRVRHPDGCLHHVEGSARIVYDLTGEPIRMVGVNIDVTERKKVEELLARQASELARSNRELQAFAYTASHDLQEPIRTIVSFTQLLARRYSGELGREADQTISFILQAANRMSKLVASLLDYSRVAEADLSRSSVNLEATFQDVTRTLDFAIRDSEAVITHNPLPTVRADDAQMHQLFQNLISNALKYRQPGEPPRIHVEVRRLAADEWQISVGDRGIGFHPDYAERIFGVFKRLHGRQYSGTGIGLAICRRIVERHGGRIWAESGGEGEGAEFHFTLPAVDARPEAS